MEKGLIGIIYLVQKFLEGKKKGVDNREAAENALGISGGPKILVRIWLILMCVLFGLVIFGAFAKH